MRALIIVLAVAIALVVIAKADETSTTPKGTFFGIDKDDEEAVRAKHRELADEQYKRMFGDDHPLPDFSGDLEPEPSKFTEKIREIAKKFSELFKRQPSTTETPEPSD